MKIRILIAIIALISITFEMDSLRRRNRRNKKRGSHKKRISNHKSKRRSKKRKEQDLDHIDYTGSDCSIDVRDYKEINLCGCKFKGFNCQVFEAFVDITNPDITKLTPLKFKPMPRENLNPD